MKLWLLCACFCACAFAESPRGYIIANASAYFEEFKIKYNKIYPLSAEAERRFQIFKSNLEIINGLNEGSDEPVFGITKFTDLTPEEFSETHSCIKAKGETNDRPDDVVGEVGYVSCNVITDQGISVKGAPNAYDWHKQGAVTAVQDQGSCGSCWAFSATGQLEGQNYIKHKKLVHLSAQQLVDCDKISSGCKGGTMEGAFKSLINDIGGSMTAKDYPYVGKTEPCRSEKSKIVVKPLRCSVYNLKSQEKLRQQLHAIGPISIAVKADGIMHYIKGVVKDEICDTGRVNHAVLLVGYGTTDKNEPYWLVKNSYGADWGENGYFRMQRGENAKSCGMMNTYMSSAVIE